MIGSFDKGFNLKEGSAATKFLAITMPEMCLLKNGSKQNCHTINK